MRRPFLPTAIDSSLGPAIGAGLKPPQRFGWNDLIVVGCGDRIHVALFFATAAYDAGPLQNQAKLGALLKGGRFNSSAARP